MDRVKQREIASKGGKAAHQKGTAHEWTSEEAREAGRKGGMASHRRRKEMMDGPRAARRRPWKSPSDRARRAATIRTSRFASLGSSSSRYRFQAARARVRRAASCLVRRGDEPIQSEVPASRECAHLDTGRSFNGRTRRSGRRYRGSNPCLPATSLAFAPSWLFGPSSGARNSPSARRDWARIPASQPHKLQPFSLMNSAVSAGPPILSPFRPSRRFLGTFQAFRRDRRARVAPCR